MISKINIVLALLLMHSFTYASQPNSLNSQSKVLHFLEYTGNNILCGLSYQEKGNIWDRLNLQLNLDFSDNDLAALKKTSERETIALENIWTKVLNQSNYDTGRWKFFCDTLEQEEFKIKNLSGQGYLLLATLWSRAKNITFSDPNQRRSRHFISIELDNNKKDNNNILPEIATFPSKFKAGFVDIYVQAEQVLDNSLKVEEHYKNSLYEFIKHYADIKNIRTNNPLPTDPVLSARLKNNQKVPLSVLQDIN